MQLIVSKIADRVSQQTLCMYKLHYENDRILLNSNQQIVCRSQNNVYYVFWMEWMNRRVQNEPFQLWTIVENTAYGLDILMPMKIMSVGAKLWMTIIIFVLGCWCVYPSCIQNTAIHMFARYAKSVSYQDYTRSRLQWMSCVRWYVWWPYARYANHFKCGTVGKPMPLICRTFTAYTQYTGLSQHSKWMVYSSNTTPVQCVASHYRTIARLCCSHVLLGPMLHISLYALLLSLFDLNAETIEWEQSSIGLVASA